MLAEAPPIETQAVFPEPGVYPDIDPECYHAAQEAADLSDRIVSKSMLWDFRKNPKRWAESPPKGKTETPEMRYGSLVDVLALTPERFSQVYAVTPKTYKAPESAKKDAPLIDKPWNWNAKDCKAWRAKKQNAGLEVITPAEQAKATKAVRELREDTVFSAMMDGARTQVAVVADIKEPQSGMTVRCKALLDIVPSKDGQFKHALVDLKTSAMMESPRDLQNTIARQGYHYQGAFYRDIWNAATGDERDEFHLVFQLSDDPFEVVARPIDEEALMMGRHQYMMDLAKWCQCIKSGEWGSPFDDVEEFTLPSWAWEAA